MCKIHTHTHTQSVECCLLLRRTNMKASLYHVFVSWELFNLRIFLWWSSMTSQSEARGCLSVRMHCVGGREVEGGKRCARMPGRLSWLWWRTLSLASVYSSCQCGSTNTVCISLSQHVPPLCNSSASPMGPLKHSTAQQGFLLWYL